MVFAWSYKIYLQQFDSATNEVDIFTEIVAKQTAGLLGVFVENVATAPHENDPSYKLFYQDKYVARVVEGCNAISVMNLFAAFVFAFATKWIKTALFISIGVLIIHVLNIIRIALLAYALYYYPGYKELLHGTVFPLFIYGTVFILWILWVTKFSGHAAKNS